MSRLLLKICAVIACSAASAGQAKVGDAAWAQCVWQKEPTGARNWLAMPTPVWRTNTQEKNAALGHLLAATCATEAANEMKPNRDFNWKQMASALKSAKKPLLGVSQSAPPTVKLCRHFVETEGKRELYRIDVVRTNLDDSTLLVFQQHFLNHEGQVVKLPQDLRAMPTEKDGKLSGDCKMIKQDGSLIDA